VVVVDVVVGGSDELGDDGGCGPTIMTIIVNREFCFTRRDIFR